LPLSPPMDEHNPVADSEFVYRRIAPVYYDVRLAIAVQPEAFRPTKNDASGISVLREHFARPADCLAGIDKAKAGSYYVSRLSVGELRKLGVSVVPDPIAGG